MRCVMLADLGQFQTINTNTWGWLLLPAPPPLRTHPHNHTQINLPHNASTHMRDTHVQA